MMAENNSRGTTGLWSLVVVLAILPSAYGQDKQGGSAPLVQWEMEIRGHLEKDPRLSAVLRKHPLVVLHSRELYDEKYSKQSAYSFVHETADEEKHRNNAQLRFHNGGTPKTFVFNLLVGQQNLVVDLGKADFSKDPQPAKISIDDTRVLPGEASAIEGHVYLQRIRDDRGNNFYVVLQVVAVDKDSRYMAFVWRKLPGGKVSK